VRDAGQALHALKPAIVFSIAGIGRYDWGGWNGYYSVFQDSALWLNEGYIDFIFDMTYHAKDAKIMNGELAGNCPKCWHDKLGKAIEAGRCFTPGVGSLYLRISKLWANHAPIVSTIRDARWPCGVVFFSYGDWETTNYFLEARKSLFP
jgi:hypothetical protein